MLSQLALSNWPITVRDVTFVFLFVCFLVGGGGNSWFSLALPNHSFAAASSSCACLCYTFPRWYLIRFILALRSSSMRSSSFQYFTQLAILFHHSVRRSWQSSSVTLVTNQPVLGCRVVLPSSQLNLSKKLPNSARSCCFPPFAGQTTVEKVQCFDQTLRWSGVFSSSVKALHLIDSGAKSCSIVSISTQVWEVSLVSLFSEWHTAVRCWEILLMSGMGWHRPVFLWSGS